MPKNPFIIPEGGKIVMGDSTTIENADGTAIVSVSSSGVATITGTETIIASEIALADTYVLVGNASGVAAGVAISGDATIARTGALTVTKSSGAFTAGGKLSLYNIGSAAASASGLLFGIGTSVAPAASSTAGAIFGEVRSKCTATSGDSRGLYWRHEIAGAAGGGECVRAFTKVTAAASTVRGAHVSVDLDAAGSVSGFGAAVDAQVMLGGAAYDDTLACVNLEVYANASATVTGATSLMRAVIQGDGTAVADVNANAFFIDFSGVTASATGLIDTDITALTGYGSLRVKCPDGVTRYIPITTGS